MPKLALLLCVVWFLVLFVVRGVIQWSRTGSTGFNGFHGRVGSLPWLAGVIVSMGFVLALAAPCASLLGWPGGALAFHSDPVHWTGALLLTAGAAGTLVAQLMMGESWRVGVDENETTRLVTTGLYAWVRNPIYTFMGVSLAGLVLLLPNSIALLAIACATVGVALQVRFVEEPYLMRVHDVAYRDYAARVGRFVPGVGRIDGPTREARAASEG